LQLYIVIAIAKEIKILKMVGKVCREELGVGEDMIQINIHQGE